MSLQKRCAGEFLGTAGLLMTVVGSGIMGETLAQGNAAIALLANSIATGAGLYALINTFGSLSGAHFNPAVSFVEYLAKKLSAAALAAYVCVQILGALVGTWVAHLMFGQNILQFSTHDRGDWRFMFSEMIATSGLIMVIQCMSKNNKASIPSVVATYITAAYWFTSSTSFANPAVTLARSFTNTFSGIAWTGAPGFIVAQMLGALAAFVLCRIIS